MQPLNDDMDELFRRAAEEYPLNTTGADWNKVLQQLHHTEGDLPKKDKKKKDYKYLWLLLLLPIGFIWGIYYSNERHGAQVEANKDMTITSAPTNKTAITTSKPSKGISGGNDNNGTFAEEADNGVRRGNGINNSVTESSGNTGKSVINEPDYKIGEQGSLRSKLVVSLTNSKKHSGIRNSKEVSSLANQSGKSLTAPKDGESQAVSEAPSSVPGNVTSNPNQTSLQTAATSAVADSNKKSNSPSNSVTDIAKSSESKIRNQNIFKRSFSYSLIIGPDLSTVKLQKTSNVGYSLGLMLKYQFAKRISVEAGALWDRKNYYTEGKYMDTNRLKLPMRSIVNSASGYCNMIEIPINVRYEFTIKQNHSWFVSGGLSSYLMKNEAYDISYERYNQPYVKDYGYINSTKDWFSIMNLSVGYQKSLGKSTNISLAPYVKLPLRGIGIGKLPVSSTGIYLSISRSVK